MSNTIDPWMLDQKKMSFIKMKRLYRSRDKNNLTILKAIIITNEMSVTYTDKLTDVLSTDVKQNQENTTISRYPRYNRKHV